MSFDPEALPVPDLGLRCFGCGHNLAGLPEHRCPECGRPFTMEEYIPEGHYPIVIFNGEELRTTAKVVALLKRMKVPYMEVMQPGDVIYGIGGATHKTARIAVPRACFFEKTDGEIDMRDFAQFQLAFTGYGSGACCHPPPYPQCTIESVDVCAAEFGATYQGHGTTCDNVECPSPNWGACCYVVESNCGEDAVENCVWQDGMYMGDGSTCAALTCPTGRYHNVIDPPTNYTPCGDGLQLADDITLNGDQPAGLAPRVGRVMLADCAAATDEASPTPRGADRREGQKNGRRGLPTPRICGRIMYGVRTLRGLNGGYCSVIV